MLHWLMVIAVALSPHSHVTPTVRAISRVTHDRREAAALLTISLYENGIGRAGVPFGVCSHLCNLHCTRCRTEPLAASARVALRVWRRSLRVCGPSLVNRFAFYHHGTDCTVDRYAGREAATMTTILVRQRQRRRSR